MHKVYPVMLAVPLCVLLARLLLSLEPAATGAQAQHLATPQQVLQVAEEPLPPVTRPPHGWATQARVVHIVDGDTVDVEITRVVRVRLLDCWAPERYSAAGPASTANLKKLLENVHVTLWVPVYSGEVADIWTFSRVLGHLWSTADADKSVSQLQVEQGFATKEKR